VCHIGCHLDFSLNTDLTSSVNAPIYIYEWEIGGQGEGGLSRAKVCVLEFQSLGVLVHDVLTFHT
jgi:hypothetical protein